HPGPHHADDHTPHVVNRPGGPDRGDGYGADHRQRHPRRTHRPLRPLYAAVPARLSAGGVVGQAFLPATLQGTLSVAFHDAATSANALGTSTADKNVCPTDGYAARFFSPTATLIERATGEMVCRYHARYC